METGMRLIRESSTVSAIKGLSVTIPKQRNELAEKVDRLATLMTEIDLKEKAFKESLAAAKAEEKALKEELAGVAEDLETTSLEGEASMLVWEGKKSRDIDPLRFFQWLKERDREQDFFKLVKVGLTATEAFLSKAIVSKSGLVAEETDLYAKVKAVPKIKN